MTDHELLDLAAGTIGLNLSWGGSNRDGYYMQSESPDIYETYWNPLDSDGDALRLAVTLRLSVSLHAAAVFVSRNEDETTQLVQFSDAPHTATRRAIVRMAAVIGGANA